MQERARKAPQSYFLNACASLLELARGPTWTARVGALLALPPFLFVSLLVYYLVLIDLLAFAVRYALFLQAARSEPGVTLRRLSFKRGYELRDGGDFYELSTIAGALALPVFLLGSAATWTLGVLPLLARPLLAAGAVPAALRPFASAMAQASPCAWLEWAFGALSLTLTSFHFWHAQLRVLVERGGLVVVERRTLRGLERLEGRGATAPRFALERAELVITLPDGETWAKLAVAHDYDLTQEVKAALGRMGELLEEEEEEKKKES